MRFVYHTCCVEADGEKITAMVDSAKQTSLNAFKRACDIADWERSLGYQKGARPSLETDWHMKEAFYRSTFDGAPCYYAVHSAIEYVFIAPK